MRAVRLVPVAPAPAPRALATAQTTARAPTLAWHRPLATPSVRARSYGSTAPGKDSARRPFAKPFARANDPEPLGGTAWEVLHDTVEIERLLAARGDAKGRRDYDAADQLAAQILIMDVVIDDQSRVYWCVPPPIGALNRKRAAARRAKDYIISDALRDEMIAAGWDFGKGPNPTSGRSWSSY